MFKKIITRVFKFLFLRALRTTKDWTYPDKRSLQDKVINLCYFKCIHGNAKQFVLMYDLKGYIGACPAIREYPENIQEAFRLFTDNRYDKETFRPYWISESLKPNLRDDKELRRKELLMFGKYLAIHR